MMMVSVAASLPSTSTAATKYSRSGTPRSWNVVEVVSPLSPKGASALGVE